MKTMLKQASQSRLEARDGILCIVLDTALDGAASKAGSPAMRQWFRVEEPAADPALVAGRPVRNIDPKEGLFVDEEVAGPFAAYRHEHGFEATPGGTRITDDWQHRSPFGVLGIIADRLVLRRLLTRLLETRNGAIAAEAERTAD